MAEKNLSELKVPGSQDTYAIDAKYVEGKTPQAMVNEYAPTKTGGGASGTWGITAKKAEIADKLTFTANADSNQSRHVWFSYAGSGNEGILVQNDKFMYNPSTNVLKVGSITGSAASATSVGDGNNKIYAEIDSEVNFGGTNSTNTIYFGYRARDSKTIPNKFVFGGSTGTATIVAANFTGKAGSVDWDNVNNKPSSLPASDVYSWAKAATKPTYGADEIKFADGETFQKKLNDGELKGPIGPAGPAGPSGGTGPAGKDGLTTSIKVNGTTYTHSSGLITLPSYPTKSSLGMSNVENKSSATIRGELTSANVTKALTYTPLSSSSIIDGGSW